MKFLARKEKKKNREAQERKKNCELNHVAVGLFANNKSEGKESAKCIFLENNTHVHQRGNLIIKRMSRQMEKIGFLVGK